MKEDGETYSFTLYQILKLFKQSLKPLRVKKKVFLKSVINAAKYITAGDKEGDDL